MKSKKKQAAKWAEAQEKCGLSDEAVQMAKESGIASRVLLRKIPPESEPLQQTVEDWVRVHEKEGERADSQALQPQEFRRGMAPLVREP